MGYYYGYPPYGYGPYGGHRPGLGVRGIGFAIALIILLFILFAIIGGGRKWY